MYAERCVVPCPSLACPIRPSTLSTYPYLNHDDPSKRSPVGWFNEREGTRAATHHLETTQNSHQSRPTATVLFSLLLFSRTVAPPQAAMRRTAARFRERAKNERRIEKKEEKKLHHHTPIQAPRARRSIASLFAQSEPNRTVPARKNAHVKTPTPRRSPSVPFLGNRRIHHPPNPKRKRGKKAPLQPGKNRRSIVRCGTMHSCRERRGMKREN
ncbi:hypothetical protein F5144DRAFT_291061 [Chaetomium tenue]|uniref:Uncharacterized protein n=1 Tax=Chaetomium tenue TaxID=1854479 RepID=A0ACB7P522_9PEZI|nr:hypothetical protein F5144DRAFT_291061 [Chaetomium globosum]